MNVDMTLNDTDKTIELTVSGYVSAADYDRIQSEFLAFMDRHDKIRMIEIVDSFRGFDPSLLWKSFGFKTEAVRHITHCAVVSDLPWVSPVIMAASALSPVTMKTFGRDELDQARNWLTTAE